jgi:hypothetical protein
MSRMHYFPASDCGMVTERSRKNLVWGPKEQGIIVIEDGSETRTPYNRKHQGSGAFSVLSHPTEVLA